MTSEAPCDTPCLLKLLSYSCLLKLFVKAVAVEA